MITGPVKIRKALNGWTIRSAFDAPAEIRHIDEPEQVVVCETWGALICWLSLHFNSNPDQKEIPK